MKFTLATLTLVALAAATPPPEPVVLKPVPEKASSGCYHYIIPKPNNCCLPRLCACKDGMSLVPSQASPPLLITYLLPLPLSLPSDEFSGNYYQFNEDAWKQKMNGCDPPWGYLGKKMHDMPSFCCRGWKAPKPVFPT
ncbi:thioesterase thiol ester dehydrase-isomerase [Fusarium sp. NRRL 25303]|nr:thioesterase thiol ester dehydrase-isomerase [Fusarium sp. NRRL 25303]